MTLADAVMSLYCTLTQNIQLDMLGSNLQVDMNSAFLYLGHN